MKKIIIYLIKVYRIIISPVLPNSCRYYPTCSQYTMEAVQKYGVLKGVLKGFLRILRCNPFFEGGYDPLK